MIKEGSNCKDKASLVDVAKHTVEVFKNTLPKDLGGVFFLSGGQGELSATNHLHYINVERREKDAHWPMSFSYGRAL